MNNTIFHEIQNATRLLESSAIPSPRLDAELLLAHALGLERIDLYKSPDRILSLTEVHDYTNLIAARCGGVPTAYLRGKKEFFGLIFHVRLGVLIPRAETELLVEEALKRVGDQASPAILELGTGSGAIIISILAHLPNAQACATDISSNALKYAAENAHRHRVANRIRFLEGDLYQPVRAEKRFDLIVSNPPYVPTSEITYELRFEPLEALDGGPDGLRMYRKILAEAESFLKPKSHLLLEIGSTNLQLLQQELKKHESRYSKPLFKKDLAGKDRLLVLASRIW